MNEYFFVAQRIVNIFQNLLCSWTPWVVLSLPKEQQDDMVQPFGHFRRDLKRQAPDYLPLLQYTRRCSVKEVI